MKKLIIIAALLLGGLGLSLVMQGSPSNEQERAGAQNRVVRSSREDITITVLSTGSVQPKNRLEIKPPVAGRIDSVLIDEGEVAKQGALLATMSSTERAAMLDAARAQGETELERWKSFYRPTPIIAPLDGTVILRNIEPGQTVTASDAVLVMSDALMVKAQVDETDIASIQPDLTAIITLDAYPEEEIPATVTKIAYEAETVNNVTTYAVEVTPLSAPATMRSGMTANVVFRILRHQNVLTLPVSAILYEGVHTFVQSRDPQSGKVLRAPVQLGVSDGERVEILSGLADNAEVLPPTMDMNRETSASSPLNFMRRKSK